MKPIVRVLVLTAASLPIVGFAQQDLVGAVTGSLSGTVENAQGNMVAPEGAVQATVFATDNGNGNVTAIIEGSASCTGGLGLTITFSAQYDSTSGNFTGQYTDEPGATPDEDVVFSNSGGLNWSAHFSGTAPSSTGQRAYDLDFAFTIPDNAVFTGNKLPNDIVYQGSLSNQPTVEVPVNVPSIGLHETVTFNLNFDGSWKATAVPQANGGAVYTGEASGSFYGDGGTLVVTIPFVGQQSFAVSAAGSFAGTLFTVSSSEVAFKGAWVANANDDDYGGDVEIVIPLDNYAAFPFTVQGQLEIATGVSQLPSVLVPFTVSGSFPLNLTVPE